MSSVQVEMLRKMKYSEEDINWLVNNYYINGDCETIGNGIKKLTTDFENNKKKLCNELKNLKTKQEKKEYIKKFTNANKEVLREITVLKKFAKAKNCSLKKL